MSGYLTTNENGEFTGTVTGLTTGQKVITATFEGDNEYNRSTTNKHITILEPTIELSLTSPAEIIETGNTTTITATLTKNDLPFVNQEILYEIKHGSTIIDRGSDFTNNAGQITISYTGTGIGDIEVIATYNSLEETLAIEDYKFYDNQSLNKLSQYITKVGSVTSTYQSGYIQIQGNTGFCGLAPNIELDSSNDWSMECEIKSNSNILNGVLLLKNNTDYISHLIYNNTRSEGYASYDYPYTGESKWLFKDASTKGTANTWYKFKMELISDTLYYYIYDSNGDLYNSKTVSLPSKYQNTNLYFTPTTDGSSTAQFRKVKIKAL